MESFLVKEFEGSGVELVFNADYRGAGRFDEVKIQRLFHNMARNAKEAMTDGGTFQVASNSTDGRLVFSFADTGRGIPEEIQDKVFDSFVTKGKKEGTGLGLAIVKRIVDEHQGEIRFESTPNEGTTFHVSLPL